MRKKIEDYTTEELQRNERTLKVILTLLLGFMAIYGLTMAYLIYQDKWEADTPLLVVPIMFIAAFFSINAIRASVSRELHKRGKD